VRETTRNFRTASGCTAETADAGYPLRNISLVSTFTAARILFPTAEIARKHVRLVQRLCERNEVESYKIGRQYRIVRQSIIAYIEKNHGRPKAETD
jgi:excisionase family DNA binding protein